MATDRTSWSDLRNRRMAEPGATEECEATRLASARARLAVQFKQRSNAA